jgi:hypothetical protein
MVAEQTASHATGKNVGAIAAASTGVSGVVVTMAATACCASPVLAPLLVSVIGASGVAWAAGMKPYRGYVLLASFFLIAWSLWTVHRPQAKCDVAREGDSRRRLLQRTSKIVVWTAAMLWAAALVLTLNMS